jgi:hypothetical protein
MGTKGKTKTQESNSTANQREKRIAKKVAKLESKQARLDDYFEDNAVRGEDNLRALRQSHPSSSPKQINPLLQKEFIAAYCDATTDRQKRNAIEIYVLTAIALYGVSDLQVIRETIIQMKKGIRAIGRAKVVAFAKKLVVPAIEVGLMVLIKKAPKASRLAKVAEAAAIGAPIVNAAANAIPKKSDAQLEQDENQAQKVIDRIRPIIGKLPKTWLEA